MPAARTKRSHAGRLRRLLSLRAQFGHAAEEERFRLLSALQRAELGSGAQLRVLHDALLFASAYPDSPKVRRLAVRMLGRFDQRRDLLRRRRALRDSGIAGTDTRFAFFAPTALWLARRWPRQLEYDWAQWTNPARLVEALPLLAAHAETPALDEWDLGPRGWLKRMKPPGLGDAAFVVRRLATRVADPFVFEKLIDGMDAPMVLRAGSSTPSRSRDTWPVRRVSWQRQALRRERPVLADAVRVVPAVRAVRGREAQRLIDLAMSAMVTHERDLDVFSYGDPRDVRLVDCGDGLQFAAIGALPERRLMLESVYGFLTLQNGVPIGYLLTSALYGSAEIAYNVFETFRGAEAALTYARVMAMTRRLFGADAFTIFPYQLGGAGNEEGLDSGAWWFYRKLGFEPRQREARRLMAREDARAARDPGYRSSRATLRRLAGHNLYWHEGARRDDVLGVLPLANVGLAVTDFLARRGGGEGGRDSAPVVQEARRLLGGGPGRGWSGGERLAFERWAPLVLCLPGVARWPHAERQALINVMRAKGGRRESDFVKVFDAHARLRFAVARLARATRP